VALQLQDGTDLLLQDGDPLELQGDAVGTLWTPADTTTQVWFDATDASTLTIVTGVSVWADKSGFGHDVIQATTTRQPLTGTRDINGLNCLQFDGSNDYMRCDDNLGAQPHTVFFVAEADDATGRRNYLMDGLGGARHVFAGGGQSSNGTASLWAGSWYSPSPPVGTTPNVLMGQYNAGSSYIGVNGARWGPGNCSGQGLSNGIVLCIGSILTQDWYRGHVGEVIIVDALLDDAEIQQFEGYLAWKWGLEGSLEPGHDYENAPPYNAPPTLPVIDTQPTNATVDEGNIAVFTLTAIGGTAPLTYQWYDASDDSTLPEGAPIIGTQTDTLSVTTVLGDNGNTYYCIVTDSA
jgi:hypothetical protein